MGSKGLWAFIKPVIKQVSLNKLKNKRLVIDIILYLHKYIISIRNKGTEIKNKNNKNITHLVSLYNIIKQLTSYNILPICVFDGKPPELKKNTVNKRKMTVEKSKKIVDELNKEIIKLYEDWEEINLTDDNVTKPELITINENNLSCENDIYIEKIEEYEKIITSEYIKHFKKCHSITKDEINECKDLLKLMGIPYITSTEEADKETAELYNKYKHLMSGILTEDSDILLYGGGCIYKDINFVTNTVNEINISDVLEYLENKSKEIIDEYKIQYNYKIINDKFNFNNLIDFSIILGNDFTNGIRINKKIFDSQNINNSTSNLSYARHIIFKQFILHNYDIPKLIKTLYKLNETNETILYYIPENFEETYKEIRDIYIKKINTEYTIDNLIMKKPNFMILNKLLLGNNILNKYNKTLFTRNLSNLYNQFKDLDQILEENYKKLYYSLLETNFKSLNGEDNDITWNKVYKNKCKINLV